MGEIKKTSVIKEALAEFGEIQKAAETNARKNLAEQYPKKFNDLLKEELNKNKSTKESYKKIDEGIENVDKSEEAETNKESVMKKDNETKEVVKEGENQPFDKKAPETGPDVVKEEREKGFMADIEGGTPNINTPLPEDGDTFTDKITTKQDTLANKTTVKEEFNIAGLDPNSIAEALDGAEAEDEIITMDEIDEEITAMNEMEAAPTAPTAGKDDGIAYDKLVSMQNQIKEALDALEEQKNQGGKQSIPGRENGGPTTQMIDEEEVDEQKNHGGKQNYKGRENGGPTTQMIDEEEVNDVDIDSVLGGAEGVDENLEHTQTHGNARKTGAENHTNYGKESRLRSAMQESEKKKISSLIKENKSLTKKLNETKKYKQQMTSLVEGYETVIGKYRGQLKEMATFNTNLSHVNNLFVNEELALTQEDKITIINEFKKVDTIAESQEKYGDFLSEMKGAKNTLTESVEDKVTASIAPSSKKLDEANEITAYKNDDHLNKMKRMIEYAENREKKTPLNS